MANMLTFDEVFKTPQLNFNKIPDLISFGNTAVDAANKVEELLYEDDFKLDKGNFAAIREKSTKEFKVNPQKIFDRFDINPFAINDGAGVENIFDTPTRSSSQSPTYDAPSRRSSQSPTYDEPSSSSFSELPPLPDEFNNDIPDGASDEVGSDGLLLPFAPLQEATDEEVSLLPPLNDEPSEETSSLLPPITNDEPLEEIPQEETKSKIHAGEFAFKREARLDNSGKLKAYRPPSVDANSLEYAGIGNVTNPKEFQKIQSLVNQGKDEEAKNFAKDFFAKRAAPFTQGVDGTKTAAVITGVIHHRGPNAGVRELASYLGVEDPKQLGKAVDRMVKQPNFKQRWIAARRKQEQKNIERVWKSKGRPGSLSSFIAKREQRFGQALEDRWKLEAEQLTKS
jgi:hypothetical protein